MFVLVIYVRIDDDDVLHDLIGPFNAEEVAYSHVDKIREGLDSSGKHWLFSVWPLTMEKSPTVSDECRDTMVGECPSVCPRKQTTEDLIARHEEITRKHHQNCYNKDKFKWEWQTIDHLGIWAFGGDDKSKEPYFRDAKFCVPKPHDEKKEGWYCYIGPQPEFSS